MTDGGAEARHFELLRMLARPGGPLRTDSPTSTMNNPAWWGSPQQANEREQLHDRLLAEAREVAGPVERGHQALVLAGPPGAGKGVMRREVLAEQHARFLVADADEFKKALLVEAIRDGSYESWIKPPAVLELEARGERFYPMEMAALVHEESSRLAVAFRREAIARGDDIVIDTVLGDPRSAVQLGRDLEAADYDIWVIHVGVPPELSAQQVRSRWAEGYREALAGRDPLGGRVVESEVLRRATQEHGGELVTRVSAWELTSQVQAVSVFRDHWTPARSEPRQLATDVMRDVPGAELTDRATGDRVSALPALPSRPPTAPLSTSALSTSGLSEGFSAARVTAPGRTSERTSAGQGVPSRGSTGPGAGPAGGRAAGSGHGG